MSDASVVAGADGSLVTEYSTTVDLVKRSIEQDSHDPFTCAVSSEFVYACLDIAASSTTASNLFGQDQLCHGVVVGDGRVNSFDTHTLIMAYFRDGTYKDVTLTTDTVQPRSDVAERCLDGTSLAAYNMSYENEKCFSRRRLEATEEDDLNAIVILEASNDFGSWYRIAIPAEWTAVELFLDISLTAPLTNKAAVDLDDDHPEHPEVRFARHGSSASCAPIIPTIDSMTAMYRNVLAVGQSPINEQVVCGFDLYLWVPQTQVPEQEGCNLHVQAGSSAMGAPRGARQDRTSDCMLLPAVSTVILQVVLSVSNSTLSYESMRYSIASILEIDVANVDAQPSTRDVQTMQNRAIIVARTPFPSIGRRDTTGGNDMHVMVNITIPDIATAHRHMTTLSMVMADAQATMTHFGVVAVSVLHSEIINLHPPPPPRVPCVDRQHRVVMGIDAEYCRDAVDVALDSRNGNLYVACRATECVYTILSDGRPICLQDRAFYHFNAHLSGIAIFDNMMATCQDSRNDYAGSKTANMFMGLTLYSLDDPWIRTDGSVFHQSNKSHVPYLVHTDMLHEAPNCTSIAPLNVLGDDTSAVNRFIHVDNFNQQLVVTDFKSPIEHSVARVERLYGLPLSNRVGGVVADPTRALAFVADSGSHSVFEVNYTSGTTYRSARHDYPIFSSMDERFDYVVRENVTWRIVAHLPSEPVHVAISDTDVYVLDAQGTLHGVDRDTLTRRTLIASIGEAARAVRLFGNTLYIVHEQALSIWPLLDASECLSSDATPETRMQVRGEPCTQHQECTTFMCTNGVCDVADESVYNSDNNLASYVKSDVYNRSFVYQHILTGGQESNANHHNMYPITEPAFCTTVGNATGTVDCDLIDFDALIYANCWGHPCLPNHLHCLAGGTVVPGDAGYVCKCPETHEGDKCQLPRTIRTYSSTEVRRRYQDAECCEEENCQITF